jgi:hypothetical protein
MLNRTECHVGRFFRYKRYGKIERPSESGAATIGTSHWQLFGKATSFREARPVYAFGRGTIDGALRGGLLPF